MKLNTLIRLTDGREGTICWHHLAGAGGIWGSHSFEMPANGFGGDLPAPEFMLREKEMEDNASFRGTHPTAECVGEHDFEVLSVPAGGDKR